MQFRCPNCRNPIQVANSVEEETFKLLSCPSCNSKISFASDATETIIPSKGMNIAHYEVRQILGNGSFGTVYEAWDTELERKVAIKVPRQALSSPETTQAFLREARSAASVTHPNVVAVYELGQYKESVYIASEFIDGVELSDFLRQDSATHDDYAVMMIKLLRAAHVFHENGVVHRDLKPGNILIDKDGEPHITDFGLARRETGHEVTVTQSGKLIGTPAYMPPEQARSDTAAISPVSDVYSLGVILYAMLTGKRPFYATDTRTLLYAIQTTEPTAVRKLSPEVSRNLETICLKAMSKAQSNRYQSAAEFADDLQRHLDGKPILARPVSVFEKLAYRIRRSPYAFMSGVLTIAILALGFWTWNQPIPEPIVIETIAPIPKTKVVVKARRKDGKAFSNCQWAIIPLDPKTRLPDLSQRELFTDQQQLELNLVPAEYLVVVNIPGYGFHEVYRNLPDEFPSDSGSSLNHRRVDLDKSSATATWADVVILSESDATNGMVLIPGGEFEMGDGSRFSPKHIRQVEDFWVDHTEVTNEQYLPSRFSVEILQTDTADQAATGMTWHSATAYAESIGKRLPLEVQYEFLATGRGQQEYPSGNAADYQWQTWPYGPVSPSTDTLQPFAVLGLFSNVAEWTDSLSLPYPGLQNPDAFATMMKQSDYQSNRVIRGGPVFEGNNDRLQNLMSKPEVKSITVRTRNASRTMTMDSELGFRCVRFVKPRFVEADLPSEKP